MRSFILTLAVAIFTQLHFTHATIPGNEPPEVTFTYPTNNLVLFSTAEPVVIRAEATDPDGSITEVRLLQNGTPIAVDLQPPYDFIFQPGAFGEYDLRLSATDNSGATTLSQYRGVQYVRVHDSLVAIPAVTGSNLILRSTNVDATHDKGEPQHAAVPGGKSVWFSWRSTNTGTVVIDTEGSDFDTVLAVYTNRTSQITSLSSLIEVAANDNDSSIAPLSRVKFTAFANNTYYIAVDGRDGFAGNIRLAIQQARSSTPPNDFLSHATRISQSVPITGSNINATKETGEPDHAGNPGGASSWFRLDLPAGETIRISTAGSSFDTVLAVYTNVNSRTPPIVSATMSDLRLVAANDDAAGTNRSEVTFVPGIFGSYWIAVDGFNGAEGMIRLLATRQVNQGPAPSNDRFINAALLSGSSALSRASTYAASIESMEPAQHAGNTGGKSVWYRWTAPASGPVYLSTEWSSFDTLLAVYVGTHIQSLSSIAFNDDAGSSLTSALIFDAVEGVEYRIAVSGYRGDSGEMVLLLNQPKSLLPRMITQWTGGRIFLSVADVAETVLLEASADLVNWEVVGSMGAGEETIEIEPSTEAPRRFYRTRRDE